MIRGSNNLHTQLSISKKNTGRLSAIVPANLSSELVGEEELKSLPVVKERVGAVSRNIGLKKHLDNVMTRHELFQ